MAIIREFFKDTRSSGPHPTEVDCGWQIVSHDGKQLLQLSTYGSDERASVKKVSQTIQLDQRGAAELLLVLQRCFPEIGTHA